MDDKIKINLQMADSFFPLTINREDEEIIRKAAKQVNIMLNEYRKHYSKLSVEKLFAMTAFRFSLEVLQLEKHNDTLPYSTKIEELTDLLEDYFRK
ncbi:MAG: cell division protein ZapA [Bacteroidaceae bacterium]|nr:cell division protein ZapA [Bacteroidaceae bacterium]